MRKRIDLFVANERLPDDFYERELESLSTPEELSARIEFLKRVDAHLEQVSAEQEDRATFDANMMISAFPVQIMVTKSGHRVVCTAAGFVASWRRLANGKFVLNGISEAGY